MGQVLKAVYKNICEAGNLGFPKTITLVAVVENK